MNLRASGLLSEKPFGHRHNVPRVSTRTYLNPLVIDVALSRLVFMWNALVITLRAANRVIYRVRHPCIVLLIDINEIVVCTQSYGSRN